MEFGAYRYPEFGLHREAVLLAPRGRSRCFASDWAQKSMIQPISTFSRIDVEPSEVPFKRTVPYRHLVPLVLHPGGQSDHG